MDAINSIIITLLTAAVGYIIARIVINYRRFAQEYRYEVEQEVRRHISVVAEEEHQGVYYWFDKNNDQFIAQGRNSDEIIAHIKERYKFDHVFVLPGLEKALVMPVCQVVDINSVKI